jgi:hypothetical protein
MITAKIRCTGKTVTGEGDNRCAQVSFGPDYAEGRNVQWALATPHLALSMTLNAAASDLFERSASYTLVFEPEREESTSDATAAEAPAEATPEPTPAEPQG